MKSAFCLLVLSLSLLMLGCSEPSAPAPTDSKPSAPAPADSDPVAAVKGGVLALDKSTTLGAAIDHYRYFRNPTWSTFETENGRRVVQAKGVIDIADLVAKDLDPLLVFSADRDPERMLKQEQALLDAAKQKLHSAEFTFQFLLNRDKTFQIKTMRFLLLGPKGQNLAERTAGDDEAGLGIMTTTLKEVYDNQLPSLLLGMLGMVDAF